MTIKGTQLARAMLSIHEAEMDQGARYPACLLSDRIERRVVIRQRGSRTLCRVGSLLLRAGRHLQEYGMPQPLPLASNATQR
jgi:hypothetical protein